MILPLVADLSIPIDPWVVLGVWVLGCVGVGYDITLGSRPIYSYRPMSGIVWVLVCVGIGYDITLCRRPIYPYRPVGGIVWVLG